MGLLVKRRVTLDLARRGTQATVPFSLGDRCAYEVIFTLRDGSEQVALPPGTSAAVTVRNGAGGTGCVDGCVIDHVNNNVIYTPTVDALSVEGNIECTLHLFDGDGGVIGAPTFIFAVSEGDKADTEGEVSKALVANPGWGIIADTENKAKEAAEAAAAANNFASQASDEVAAAQTAAGEARAEADRAHDEAELSKMWANGGITLDEPPSEINNSYYWAMMSATERISAETQVGLAAAEVNNARTEVQNAAAEVEKAKAEAQTAEAEAIKARMWAVGEKNTPGKTSPSDSNNAMYYSNKSRDYMNEAEKYTNMTLSLSVDREKHIYTVSLIRDGTVIGNPIEIDLPFEEVVVGGEYDDTAEALVLKLKNGKSVSIPVGEIISPDDVVRRQYPGSYDAVYTETSSGEVVLLPVKVYSDENAGNTLVKRGSLGEIRTREIPEFDDEAAPKRYVDEVADALGKGLEDLKEWVTQNQPAPVEIVQNLGDSSTAVISQKGVTDAIDGLALKGSASGKIIRVDDVAPGEYPVKVKVRGKNLAARTNTNTTVTADGITYTVNVDGTVSATGTATGTAYYLMQGSTTYEASIPLKRGKYTIGIAPAGGCRVSVGLRVDETSERVLYYSTSTNAPTFEVTNDTTRFDMILCVDTGTTVDGVIFYPQLELGDTATDYEPYVDPSSVKVTRYGATTSDSSQTYTPNADGTVDGVLSLYPVMTLVTDNTAAILDVEYNKNINSLITHEEGDSTTHVMSQKAVTKAISSCVRGAFTPAEVVVASNNLYNPEEVEQGGYYAWGTGAWTARSDLASTGFIPCEGGRSYYKGYNETLEGGNVCFYDENFEYISGLNVVQSPFTVPEDDKIKYFKISFYNYPSYITGYQINADAWKDYDTYETVSTDATYTVDADIFAPNISDLVGRLDHIEAKNALYYAQTYQDAVVVQHKRSVSFGTTYWLFIISQKDFAGRTIKPKAAGTDVNSPLGSSGVTNLTAYASANTPIHAINGGIYLVASNEADGITIIDGQILKDTVCEQFNREQYVLGIDNAGNFKTYIGTSAADILADGCVSALTGFVPLIVEGERVGDDVLAVCPHYHIRHPRQIIGRLTNGDYFTFACDGRTTNENGMTLAECISTLTEDLSIDFAFNLDGGGSAQSVVGKKLVNRMLDNRAVPNVIVFQS